MKSQPFWSYPQVMHSSMMSICEVFASISEYRSQRLPQFLDDVRGFCQKKWLLHYGNTTILGVQNYPDKYVLPEWHASWRLKSTFHPTAVDGEAILDDYGVPLWCLHGRKGI